MGFVFLMDVKQIKRIRSITDYRGLIARTTKVTPVRTKF